VGFRILHVAPYSEHAWGYGGIPRVLAAVSHAQVSAGHQVTVCASDVADAHRRMTSQVTTRLRPWPARFEPDGLELRVFPNVSNTLAYHLQLFAPVGLAEFVRQRARSFDVAHLYACHNLPVATAARILHDAGVPYLLAPHGTAPLIERRKTAKWIFDKLFARRLLEDARLILAVSEAEKAQLLSLGVAPHRIRVVPNPIDLGAIRQPTPRGEFRRRWRLPWEKIVLYLGKLTPRKGVDVLLRAFAKLKHASTGLVIAGNDMGSERELRRIVREHSLQDRVLFTGLIRGEERFDLLADADVLAYPSRHEVFGLVPLEALICGTPVIVGDDNGCGEMIARTGGGKIVPHGDELALKRAISEMLDQPTLWRAAAAEAGKDVRRFYSGDSLTGQLGEIYHQAMRG
jgi:glycosyltransferase involved in cell wall biosynthesis